MYFRNAASCIFVVDITSENIEIRLDVWINEFMTMGLSGTQGVHTDGSRTQNTSSIGSSDFHVDQH